MTFTFLEYNIFTVRLWFYLDIGTKAANRWNDFREYCLEERFMYFEVENHLEDLAV